MSLAPKNQPAHNGHRRLSRAASVLVCVLVTLLVTGLLIAQSYRLLMAASKSQGQLLQAEQGRELLLLGKQLIAVRLQHDPQYRGESIVVPLGNSSSSKIQTAHLMIARRSADSTAQMHWDVTVTYPADSPNLFTANWEITPQ